LNHTMTPAGVSDTVSVITNADVTVDGRPRAQRNRDYRLSRAGRRIAAIGNLGLGLSNPRIALFLEGDAAMLLTADGPIQELDSQEMTLRLVDGGFGPALVSGQVKLR